MFHQKFFRHQWCRHTWPQNKIAKYLVNIWKKLRCNTCEEVTTNLFCLGFLALVVFALRVGDGGKQGHKYCQVNSCMQEVFISLWEKTFTFAWWEISLLHFLACFINNAPEHAVVIGHEEIQYRYTTLPIFLKEAHTGHLSKVLKDVFRHSWSA